MKKTIQTLFIFITILFISNITTCVARPLDGLVQLVPAATLQARLSAIGMSHFLEKTRIHEELGGATKYIEGVQLALELAIYDYTASLPEVMAIQMEMSKARIMNLLLQDAVPVDE